MRFSTLLILSLSAFLTVTCGTSFALSKWYWGYAVVPPSLPDDLGRVLSVESLTRERFAPVVLRGLGELGLPEALPAVDPILQAAIEKELRASPLFDRGEPPYLESSQTLPQRMIATFTMTTGARRAYATFVAGPVANDHYAQHELLFTLDGPRPRLLHHERFYFDFAGIEGFEGPLIVLMAPFVIADFLRN